MARMTRSTRRVRPSARRATSQGSARITGGSCNNMKMSAGVPGILNLGTGIPLRKEYPIRLRPVAATDSKTGISTSANSRAAPVGARRSRTSRRMSAVTASPNSVMSRVPDYTEPVRESAIGNAPCFGETLISATRRTIAMSCGREVPKIRTNPNSRHLDRPKHAETPSFTRFADTKPLHPRQIVSPCGIRTRPCGAVVRRSTIW